MLKMELNELSITSNILSLRFSIFHVYTTQQLTKDLIAKMQRRKERHREEVFYHSKTTQKLKIYVPSLRLCIFAIKSFLSNCNLLIKRCKGAKSGNFFGSLYFANIFIRFITSHLSLSLSVLVLIFLFKHKLTIRKFYYYIPNLDESH